MIALDSSSTAALIGVAGALFIAGVGAVWQISRSAIKIARTTGEQTQAFNDLIRTVKSQGDLIQELDQCVDRLRGDVAKNDFIQSELTRIDHYGTQHSQTALGELRDRLVRLETLTGNGT